MKESESLDVFSQYKLRRSGGTKPARAGLWASDFENKINTRPSGQFSASSETVINFTHVMRKLIVGFIILGIVAIGAAVGIFHYKHELELSRRSLADAVHERETNAKALADAVKAREYSDREAAAIKLEVNKLKTNLAKVEKERDAFRLAPTLSRLNMLMDLKRKNVAVVLTFIPVDLFSDHELSKDFITIFGVTGDEKVRLQRILDEAYLEVSKANCKRAKVERRSADVVAITLPADPMKPISGLYQHVLDEFSNVLGPERMAGVMEFCAQDLKQHFSNENLPGCENVVAHIFVITRGPQKIENHSYVIYTVEESVFSQSGDRITSGHKDGGVRSRIQKSLRALMDLLPKDF